MPFSFSPLEIDIFSRFLRHVLLFGLRRRMRIREDHNKSGIRGENPKIYLFLFVMFYFILSRFLSRFLSYILYLVFYFYFVYISLPFSFAFLFSFFEISCLDSWKWGSFFWEVLPFRLRIWIEVWDRWGWGEERRGPVSETSIPFSIFVPFHSTLSLSLRHFRFRFLLYPPFVFVFIFVLGLADLLGIFSLGSYSASLESVLPFGFGLRRRRRRRRRKWVMKSQLGEWMNEWMDEWMDGKDG